MGTVYDLTGLESSAVLQSGPQSSQTASASINRAKCDNYSIQPAVSDIVDPDYLHIMDQIIQGGSNMTGTDLCVNKPHCAAAVRP